jgi:hypothetical protein
MKKLFKIFVIKNRDRYWFQGDEGDGQYWVKDPRQATIYTEINTELFDEKLGILKDFTLCEQYSEPPDGETFWLEELPVLEEINGD